MPVILPLNMENSNQTKNSNPYGPPLFSSHGNGFVAQYFIYSSYGVYKSNMFYIRGVGFSQIFKNMMCAYLKKRYRYNPSHSDVELACLNISLNETIDFPSRAYRQYKLTHKKNAVNNYRSPIMGLGSRTGLFPVFQKSLKRLCNTA